MKTLGSWSFALRSLIFTAGVASASAASAVSNLDWSMVSWPPSSTPPFSHTYTLPPDNVNVTIAISTTATGSFTVWNGTDGSSNAGCLVQTPRKDGPSTPPEGTPLQSMNLFGPLLDLGVAFDPAAGPAGNAPVLIDITFTDPTTGLPKAVSTLNFQISDIDWSGPGRYLGTCNTGCVGWRRDKVVVTADNNGASVFPPAFMITANQSQPAATVTVGPADTALADGTSDTNGQASPPGAGMGSDNGSVTVNFGSTVVTHVLLIYSEASFGQPCSATSDNCPSGTSPGCVNNIVEDPGVRGIGILGMTTLPVTLTEFTIE